MDQTAPKKTKRQRTCISCGMQDDKVTLLRIVRDPSGAVSFDASGRKAGRGAYVCSLACFTDACKKNKIARSLKKNPSDEEISQIATDIAAFTRDGSQD